MGPVVQTPDRAGFQTHPCGVEVTYHLKRRDGELRFRRTLVGLKCHSRTRRGTRREFQTHPCGVEVARHPSGGSTRRRFRRTLVGLKSINAVLVEGDVIGFRRTLVGLKYRVAGERLLDVGVSDAPLWG